MRHPLVKNAEDRMNKAVEKISEELRKMRTGRPSPAILEEIKVDYYGAQTPISQLATVNITEDRALIIKPWDRSVLSSIEKAIFASDLGLTPQNDGNVIRLTFPTPTTEQRQKWAKKAKEIAEQGKIAIRNIRRDILKELKGDTKDGKISEDDEKRIEKEIQDLTDKKILEIDKLLEKKEKEIMEV
ncbi:MULTISPECIES: ribosome recycling factor [Pseudothermotoga]|jgi:ribosome recycling factor|uniref:Ribosome-recycling factor n=1 Tax=Pseudothermotoga lettingae (strain ATCC BAA-301 / DSM 14385 / NBRC 107922 / TMO) TaxID=416591 RepID=RRF_PSELT|nr:MULTISPECIES: ribosome recycling factor [Pseudothermotoga]A8F863.1 RecName: Full=Ribosome-recycling factor; Short=RRF; AltName: Full=Ribosome-releasing factor [Pseudothermotoga lettingae TMO]ABV34347.1 ribosome recycling factor [Pseudothermotoga lettingae TMO]KUK20097.1 MAG: Ribosome-recycling factor [Pseudothermotoga lettingae]MDI3494905.1 ribosome recycling factor [Pseudothermotoga sp.]MDK2885048.1 ribosome recycling factor [Pseudothermotoga sp.]GLI48708.1 ribosome-recycling factor [Pseu